MKSYSAELQNKSFLYSQQDIKHNRNSGALWGHVPLKVFVVSGWRSCSLSDASLVLTQIRPHSLEETGSPRIRDLPLSITDSHADLCLGMLRAPSLQFLCQLRFRSDTGPRVTAPGSWILYNLFLWGESCALSFKSAQPHCWSWLLPKFEAVCYGSCEIYVPTCPGKCFILFISFGFEMESRFVLRHRCRKCSGPKISKYLTVLVH